MTVTIVHPEIIDGVPCTRKVRSSSNLRAIVTHNRYHGKPVATVVNLPDGSALVGLQWPNGDVCNTPFASAYVAWRWLEHRTSSREQVFPRGNDPTNLSTIV
jgi:hypothetical protein